jgi:ribosomal protein S18 acetylase RimI-like enzyme
MGTFFGSLFLQSIIMVKSKELKLLRKRLERAEKVDPFKAIGGDETSSRITWELSAPKENEVTPTKSSNAALGDGGSNRKLTVEYVVSADVTDDLLKQFVNLFQRNMSELYEQSSWGLNLEEKAQELQHRKARFLVVRSSGGDELVVAFLHFRICFDDDEDPATVVLYVFEIQVETNYQNQALGRRLMALAEQMAKAVTGIDKVMLTCFKRNVAAMRFYLDKLSYEIDESSPRKWKEYADYEILSKKV